MRSGKTVTTCASGLPRRWCASRLARKLRPELGPTGKPRPISRRAVSRASSSFTSIVISPGSRSSRKIVDRLSASPGAGDDETPGLRAGRSQGGAAGPAGAADDRAPRRDLPLPPRFLQDVAGDAVLRRAAGVEKFELAPDDGLLRLQPNRHQRRR